MIYKISDIDNLKLIKIIESLVEIAEKNDDDYFNIVASIALLFPKSLVEQLKQLLKNPTYDGDVISKSQRDDLLTMRLAVRVCCNGRQGYTAARYIAYFILDKIKKEDKE